MIEFGGEACLGTVNETWLVLGGTGAGLAAHSSVLLHIASPPLTIGVS